jgi:dipeptidyl aminopeptidase/acylaminoacyl peptidase
MVVKRAVFLSVASVFLIFARGPEDRVVTDPSTIVSPKNATARPVPIEDLFVTRSMLGGAWSPDGKEIVFTTNITGRLNIWKVAAGGGWPVQMTVSDERQMDASFSPDGAWIVWMEDQGGNRSWDLWGVPAHGGTAVNLTNTPDVNEQDATFSPDSKQMAWSYRPKGAHADILAVMDVATRVVRKLTKEAKDGDSWTPFAWSHDGKWIYANRSSDDGAGNIFRVDAVTGRAENLTPASSKVGVHIEAVALSPNERTLLVESNERASWSVGLVDVATRKLRLLTDLGWDAYGGDFSPDGSEVSYSVSEDGRRDAYVVSLAGGRPRRVPVPAGTNYFPSSFAPKGERLLVAHQSSTTPNDLWVVNLATGSAKQITHSALPSLDAAAMPEARTVHYKSFDGTMISALLFVPFNLERNGRNPGIVMAHGGPADQSSDTFDPTITALVTRGYTVIAPNVRGSRGYGLRFQEMNDNDFGGGDLQDEVFAAKFLASTGFVDPKKIGFRGVSYGGFLGYMAIGMTPDVWAAAVGVYPALGTAEKYLLNAKAPLLILHGENDPNVPKEQSERAVSILKAAGKTVEAHYYPGEGHGFMKRETQIDAARRTIEWFEKYLK